MCEACDNAATIHEDGFCMCGGALEPTGEQITTAIGPVVFVCAVCKKRFHIPEFGYGIAIKKTLRDYPTLEAKWNGMLGR